MITIPSIDIYNNKVVRLKKGLLEACTTYALTPLEALKWLQEQGANQIHIVDLSGAFQEPPQLKILEALGQAAVVPVQTGGGIRTLEDINIRRQMGFSYTVISSACFIDPLFFENAMALYSKNLILALDLKEDLIAIKGWTETTDLTINTFMTSRQVPDYVPLLVTDISKDGLLFGPSYPLYKTLLSQFKNPLMASGGVRGFADIEALSNMGLHYAIMGRALYEGKLNEMEVKQCLQNASYPV